MDEVNRNQNVVPLLKQYFELDVEPATYLEETFSDQVSASLALRINYLLDHDFSALLNALYRIDIDESQFKKLFEKEDVDLSEELTSLVLERIKTKLAYRSRNK